MTRQDITPKAAALPGPPSIAREWVQYLLGFGVSVGVGLAPYLGKLDIPLFTPLLRLIPDALQDTVLPLSAALMGIVAVVVQWYGGDKLSSQGLRTFFRNFLLFTLVAFVSLIVVHTFVVVQVPILGGKDSVTFLAGFSRPMKQPCTSEVSNAECIKLLTFDYSRIESFWGDRRIQVARLALLAAYLTFTACFGALTGIALLRVRLKRGGKGK